MIERTPWFERSFSGPIDAGSFASIVERLRGAPARVVEKVDTIAPGLLTLRRDDRWSIQENIGHLVDLEPLWAGRLDDLLAARSELRPADLENRATFEADHNSTPIRGLLSRFGGARRTLVERLKILDRQQVQRSALHPRLQRPMTVLDLCLFIAEHDDHHLARMTEILDLVG